MKVRVNRCLLIKIIFFLYFAQFVLSYMNGTWYISSEKYTMMPIYTSFVNCIRLLYLFSMLLLGIYEIAIQWKYLCSLDKILFSLFYVLALFKLIETSKIVDQQTLLFQAGTPMVYIAFIMFFVGMDEKAYQTIFKLAKAYGFMFIALSMVYFLLFCLEKGYSIGIRFASGPILFAFNNGIFCLIYALYQEEKFRKSMFWIIALPMCVLSAIITTSRSWVIQALLMVMMYFILQNKGKKLFKNIFKAILGMVAIYVLSRIILPDTAKTLLNRIGESTRSSQLETFFKQVPLSNLIFGLGYYASYTFLGWTNYQYIDNQVIFSAFRYGALITILYMYFLVKPMFITFIRGSKEKKIRAVGMGHFVLALMGFSIYFSISIDMFCIIAYMLSGRIYRDLYMNCVDEQVGGDLSITIGA